MSARDKTWGLMERARRRGIELDFAAANLLRRAELTLHRWGERECGNSNDYASFGIERDEKTGIPYNVIYPHNSNQSRRYRIPDLEGGALKRVAALCAAKGLHFYHQTDPRGGALYISASPLTDSDYNSGLYCGA